MKLLGIEFAAEKTCLSVTIGNVCFGIGWWVKGHWKRFDGWFMWTKAYYDGQHFGCRLGPLFFSRGPY